MQAQRRWSDVFHRSSVSPVVFVVSADFGAEVWDLVKTLGMPEVTWVSMFSPAYWSLPLLDGVVIQNSNYGFPAMMLPDAIRVVGFAPMRLLCELMDLKPPRRLKWEASVASGDELGRQLEAQRARPTADLEQQAQIGLNAGDRNGLLQVVHDLFGDEGLPPLLPDERSGLRAEDEWGDLGATVGIRDQLQTLGITPAEICRWRELGFLARLSPIELSSAKRLHALSPSDVERLGEDGFSGWTAIWMLEKKLPAPLMCQYQELGCGETWIVVPFEESGLGIAGLRLFLDRGWDPGAASYWAKEGVAADEAELWADLGFGSWEAGRVRSGGGTVESASELIESGLTPDEVRQRFSERAKESGRRSTVTEWALDFGVDTEAAER